MALVAGIALVGFPEVGTGQEPVLLQLRGEAGSWLEYTHRKEIRVELPSDLGGPATGVKINNAGGEVPGGQGRVEVDRPEIEAVAFGRKPDRRLLQRHRDGGRSQRLDMALDLEACR